MLATGQLADDKQNNFKLHTIVLDELHRSIGTECLRKTCYHSCNPDSVQNPQFSLFQGQWLGAALWALRQNCAEWKYFNSNLCRMLEDVLIKGFKFVFKNSGISCLALIFNPRTTILHAKNWFHVARYNEYSLQPLGHSSFAWHWACQCTDTLSFIVLHSLQFLSFLDFVSGDLVLIGF